MAILSYNKPKKLRSTKEHNANHLSDSGVAGTYIPNMSKEDKQKWKAKHIKGKKERVEIRKTFGHVNTKIIVYTDGKVELSTNGKISVDFFEFVEIFVAIDEAQDKLGLNYGLAEFLDHIDKYIDEEDLE